ncbi:MAG: PD-(D/E)XK nuclease family protein [Oscillospiraceae bacterium]|nr:PD-(D/E)XK nuclease family protein [Oscillospiraceae bacterium]
MLRLILSTDWIAGREAVLREVAQQVRERRGNQILMVPELISHDTERRLCAAAGDIASRYAEVLSFPRLLRRVCEQTQNSPRECLDNGGRLTAMASAVQQLSSQLKSYARLETRPEFLTGLLDVVDEFKRCCITPADLHGAAERIGLQKLRETLGKNEERSSGILLRKLEELALILESYDSVCARSKADPRDQMNWLLEQLEICDFAEKHEFYIEGFPDLTRQHMAIVCHLIERSPMVTVCLTTDCVASQHPGFEKAGQTARELVDACKRMGVAVEVREVKPRQDALSPVRELLFQGRIEPVAGLEHHLFPGRSDSVFDECQSAAEKVMDLVRGGCRYRDIGIVCADPGYEGVLSLVFHRCGLPVYLSGTDDILEKTAIATVLSALDAAMDGLEQRDVLRYLKSMLSPVECGICDKLENYAVLWGIRGEKWNRPFTHHPEGLGREETPASAALLSELNKARARGIAPLIRLRDGMRSARNLHGMVEALLAFLDEIRLCQRLELLAEQADRNGDNRAAQEYNQLWEILLGALEQLDSVLGESKWEPEAFSRLLRLLLSQYDVGTIPTVLDAVMVGSVSAMRCQQVKHMMILGAAEGNLPRYGGSAGVLSDSERTKLRELGVPLTGGAMEGVEAEFAEIYGCFCAATETITVTCPAGQSSFVYRRLCQMVGKKDGISLEPGPGPALTDRWEAGAYLARWREAELADELLLKAAYDDVLNRVEHGLGEVSPERIRELYGKKLRLSASQIDRQAECRLSYFLRYGLRAQELKELTVDPAEFGTFVHAVLEETVKEIMELGGFHQVSAQETLDIAHRHAEAYARERFQDLDSERLSYLFLRNGLELDMVVRELWEELSRSKFEPIRAEVRFGEGGEMQAVPIHGQKMDAELIGAVDRVDMWFDGVRRFLRVVDYKTGKKDFDYCDVFNGVGLQMLLYLFALEQEGTELAGGRPTVAGVQYFPARFPYLSKDGRLTEEEARAEHVKNAKRRGLILSDDDVLEAMEPGGEFTRLSCKRNKSGELKGDVADSGQLRQLRKYVFRTLADAVDSIAGGSVDANPYTRGSSHSACAFCPYGSICARDREAGRRNYKKMDAPDFWERIGREEHT